jgi:hypothetical protein
MDQDAAVDVIATLCRWRDENDPLGLPLRKVTQNIGAE